MRVAHLIKVIRIAGAEQHLLTLLAGLRARGLDARLILVVEPDTPMDNYAAALAAREIPVERMPIYSDVDVPLVARLRQTLRTLKPDIVHTHLLHADLFGLLAARLAGVPVVISSRHNDDAFRSRFPIRQVNWGLWRWVDAGIAISDAIAQFSLKIEGAPAAKLNRIYYGLDTAALDRPQAKAALLRERNLPANTVLIGLVCRLVEQKGVLTGLRAFAQIAAQCPEAHLLIAGEGPLQPILTAEAQTLNLAERVHFLGWRENIPPLLASLDVLLAPSLWEGFGLVILEAMAQQTPVIASAVSAIPEIIVQGETGLLVPPRDVGALAAALQHLLTDAPLRQHMGLLGRDRLETHFSAARMVAETAALYEKLLPRKAERQDQLAVEHTHETKR